MADHSVVETIISGVLTGGATAGTAILGFFRDLKKRLADLETKVGSTEDKKGVLYTVQILNESIRGLEETVRKLESSIRKLREEIDDWEVDPPEWVQTIRRRSVSIDIDHQGDFERSVNQRFREFDGKINDLEQITTRLTRKLVSLEESLRESDMSRAKELGSLRESIAAINGLMRGLQSLMDNPPRR